nr:hypothetical protein [Sicyoidochytrium minutum DNA virus]
MICLMGRFCSGYRLDLLVGHGGKNQGDAVGRRCRGPDIGLFVGEW